jgi:hypothetical protein
MQLIAFTPTRQPERTPFSWAQAVMSCLVEGGELVWRWPDRIVESRTGRRRGGRFLRRSGPPGTMGGRRCFRGPTPDPARCLPLGHLAAGLQPACQGGSAFKGNSRSQPRESCGEGCRECRLCALPRQNRPAARSSTSHRPAGRPIQGANRAAAGKLRRQVAKRIVAHAKPLGGKMAG